VCRSNLRDRRGRILCIDARKLGKMIDRLHRELADGDIRKIAHTYHAWRGDRSIKRKYQDVPEFCKRATLAELRAHGYVLMPGRYVGAEIQQDDDEPFEEQMARLVSQLREQQAEAAMLDAAIASNLHALDYWEKPR